MFHQKCINNETWKQMCSSFAIMIHYPHQPLKEMQKNTRDGGKRIERMEWKGRQYLFLLESQLSSLSTKGASNLRKFGTEAEECNLALNPLSPDGLRDRAGEWQREKTKREAREQKL